jgi:hypothetical protein
MMKAAGNRPRGKLAVPLDRSAIWRLLVHEQMRPDFIVIVGVGEKIRRRWPSPKTTM